MYRQNAAVILIHNLWHTYIIYLYFKTYFLQILLLHVIYYRSFRKCTQLLNIQEVLKHDLCKV